MGGVIHFEERAVARLRQRLGAVEEANQDLIAFARGHSGAVSSIHCAVLAALDAQSLEELLQIITDDWPEILGLDAVALAMAVGNRGFRVDHRGLRPVEAPLLRRWVQSVDAVEMRSVARGHPLFGADSSAIGAEALVRIDWAVSTAGAPGATGLLVLGQRSGLSVDTRHGLDLLMFLGRSLSAMLQRWLTEPRDSI